jgi:C-terminal peptidase prc
LDKKITSSDPNEEIRSFDQSQKIKDALSLIQSKYLDSINPSEATDLVLSTYLAYLDPYSEYIPSDKTSLYADQINGKSKGLGFSLTLCDSVFIVSYIEPKSPAYLAGLRIRDHLIQLNAKSIDSTVSNVDSLIASLVPDSSQSYSIKWQSYESNEIQELIIHNTQWSESPVCGVHSPAPATLYIKLEQLSKESYRQFMRNLEQYFESKHYHHLIIDLRDNSGGLVHEAAFILNQLITEKNLLMFKTAGGKSKEKEYRSTGKPFFDIDKMVLLVNENTASAAELIAAALQDIDRAYIIGQPTMGKSTVLEQFSLGDGSAIRLAVSRFITYSGRSIQKNYTQISNIEYLSKPEWKADTEYFSIKKKKLISHNGVIPDLEIKPVEIPEEELSIYRTQADRFVAVHYKELKKLIDNDPDHIFNDRRIKLLINTALLKLYPSKKQTSSYQHAEIEFRYALARWFFGKDLEKILRLKNDDYFLSALENLSG